MRDFRISLSPSFKANLRARSLLGISVFIHVEIRNNYHKKGSSLKVDKKLSEVQLLRLRAAFHTSPLFEFTHVKPVKVYVRTHVKIMRQWKSTFKLAFKGTEENSKIVHQLETPVCLLRVN